jgi:hypothetical protein
MTMRLAALGALPFLVAAFAFLALIPVVVTVAAAGLLVAAMVPGAATARGRRRPWR